MRGLLGILSLFCYEFNKLNNTGPNMLDSFNSITLNYLETVFGLQIYNFAIYTRQ